MLELKYSNEELSIFEEEPSYKLINWYSTEKFYLPMPYLTYFLSQYNNAANHFLITIGMSNSSVDQDPKISKPVLPNTYGWTLCGTGYGRSVEEAITKYWHSSFTSDGKAAQHPTWRYLSNISGKSLRSKKSILEWWEANLDLESIIELPYWKKSHYLEMDPIDAIY